jgi:hypothetical protein
MAGSPFTLGQSQKHLLDGPLGPRLSFKQVDPLKHLEESTEQYDCVVLCICIWYFDSPSLLAQYLEAMVGKTKRVLIAEYSLTSAIPEAIPHVLAAHCQAAVSCAQESTSRNIRCAISPSKIQEMAASTGWIVSEQDTVVPIEYIADGRWEVEAVMANSFEKEIRNEQSERLRYMFWALRDSVVKQTGVVGGKSKVRTMDIWVGSFEWA